MADGAIEVALEPVSTRFDPRDGRWVDEAEAFEAELREHVEIRPGPRPAVTGAKGVDGVAIVAALGSAGAFTALSQFLQAWLGRDRTCSVKVSWYPDGKLQEIEVTSKDFEGDGVAPVLAALRDRLDEPG